MCRTITACRICGRSDLKVVLDLGLQALTGVFPRTRNEKVPRGPLCVVKCREESGGCGLVQLRDSYEASAMYGENYGYRSGLNQSMVRHLQEKADRIRKDFGVKGTVLDIGSNDSTLLQALDGPGVTLVGMDPTGEKFRRYYPPHIRLIPDFFSAARFRSEIGDRKVDLITSISMFYDLENPCEFAREIASILAIDGVWVFEQSYLPTMLERNSYDTVCHEHLEYYALGQILYITEKAGLKIVGIEFNDVNGGSFSVTAAHRDSSIPECRATIAGVLNAEREAGIHDASAWRPFGERINRERDTLLEFLQRQKAGGNLILGYGASTKGNVLLQYCGITPALLPFIAEVNPDKFGSFTPGTCIPIVSEEQARAAHPAAYVVLPWHFREHILNRESEFLAQGGKFVFPLPVVDIVGSHSVTNGKRLPANGD